MSLRHIVAAMILPAAGFFALPPAAHGQGTASETEWVTTARAGVEDVINQSGGQAAVAYRSLDGTRELFIQADEKLPATSQWVEIPVVLALYAEVEARALKFDNTLVVQNSFRSAADGSLYHLDPDLDTDAEFYKQIGQRVSLRDLETRMMMQNSQLATNLLIQVLGMARIGGSLAQLHVSGVALRHGFQDTKAESAGMRNTVSARGMMEVLWSLATDNAISAATSKEIIGVLANSRTATSGPAAGQQANGSVSGNNQEAVIVYGARSFALTVVVRGLKSGAASSALIAKISHQLSTMN